MSSEPGSGSTGTSPGGDVGPVECRSPFAERPLESSDLLSECELQSENRADRDHGAVSRVTRKVER
jgi:hypothetical protein